MKRRFRRKEEGRKDLYIGQECQQRQDKRPQPGLGNAAKKRMMGKADAREREGRKKSKRKRKRPRRWTE